MNLKEELSELRYKYIKEWNELKSKQYHVSRYNSPTQQSPTQYFLVTGQLEMLEKVIDDLGKMLKIDEDTKK